jgi:hypothetical protein
LARIAAVTAGRTRREPSRAGMAHEKKMAVSSCLNDETAIFRVNQCFAQKLIFGEGLDHRSLR